MADQELGRIADCLQLVGAAGEAVALVLIHVVFDLDAAGAQPFDDLIAFALDHPRVVGALDDKQRRP